MPKERQLSPLNVITPLASLAQMFEDVTSRLPVVVSTPHGLDSGQIVTEDYIDFDLAVRDPYHAARIASLYALVVSRIKRDVTVDSLAFIKKDDTTASNTIGAISLAALIATREEVWRPYVIVRLDKDIPHERIKFHDASNYSELLRGLNFVLVTDHISRGREIMKAVKTLWSYDATVTGIISYSCRRDLFSRSDEIQELKDRDINVFSWVYAWVEKDSAGRAALTYAANQELFKWCTS